MPNPSKKILIVQTAFIGDAILASSLIESIKVFDPSIEITLLVRKGNHTLYSQHPYLKQLLVWDKKQKWRSLIQILKKVRKEKYDFLVCVQRHTTMTLFSAFSKAKVTVGFNENLFSFLFTHRIPHGMGDGRHETQRNHSLLEKIFERISYNPPKLYPSKGDFLEVEKLKTTPYRCFAPSSVWFTKQLPVGKWIELIRKIPENEMIYLLGGPGDKSFIQEMISLSGRDKHIVNLAGSLSLLQSAVLMKDALMNYVNDSAPLHLCSSMNAPVTAFFCSTVPDFGFGPLSDIQKIVETSEQLTCRPCGLHGKKECPRKHFACGNGISISDELVT